MISRQKLSLSVIFILIVSLFLAGCVRSVPEGEATAVPAEPDISDPNVGGGTSIDPTAAPETAGQLAPTKPAPTLETDESAESGYPPAAEETVVEEAVVVAEQPTAEATEITEQTVAETETIMETAVASECPKNHVVQPGENLFRIGLQYGLSWVALAQYNGITNPNTITVGQTIKIPCEATTPPPAPPTPPPDNVTYYTVQPGDNLFRIGLKFGVSWVEIAEANGLVNPNQIYAGQVLKIPTSAPGSRPEFTHIVKQGETVYSISVQYGVPAATIAEANNLEYPYVIYAGQTLIIPGNG